MYDTLEMVGYGAEFPRAHVDFLRKYRARIHRLAVVHELKSIAFVIATVSLSANTSIKGFSSMPEALDWLHAR